MAVDIFLKFDTFDGDSQDKEHTDEVDVLDWRWGGSQSGTMHIGTGGGAGKVDVQDMTILKYHDKATPNLWKILCNGKHEKEVKLTARKAGGDAPVEYLVITLKEVLVSSMATGGSSNDDLATETVTLNFAEFKMEYTPQDEKGAAGAKIEAGWNIRKNEPV